MNIFHFVDYRDYLIAVFQNRQTRNSAYSLRAYARDLSITASLVSRIMRRKDSISLSSAARIAKALKLGAAETEYFTELHLFKKSKDPFRVNRLREIHRFEITRKTMDGSYLLELKDFVIFLKISLMGRVEATVDDAIKLDRQPEELWECCERLAAARYLNGDRENGWSTNLTHVLTDDEASDAKKDFHRMYLMNAVDALFKHPDERYFYSAMRSFRQEDFETVCRSLENFVTSPELSPSLVKDHDMIYLLGTQLIPMEKIQGAARESAEAKSIEPSADVR